MLKVRFGRPDKYREGLKLPENQSVRRVWQCAATMPETIVGTKTEEKGLVLKQLLPVIELLMHISGLSVHFPEILRFGCFPTVFFMISLHFISELGIIKPFEK